jgi:hypothetical protein
MRRQTAANQRGGQFVRDGRRARTLIAHSMNSGILSAMHDLGQSRDDVARIRHLINSRR